jgi:hypothetical protein
MARMETRRLVGPLLAALFVGALAWTLFVPREREPERDRVAEGPPGAVGTPAPETTPPPAAPPADAPAGLPVAWDVPAGWTKETPSSSMRVAQWALAPEGDGEGATVAVFSGIGGGVAANVERWEGEFGGAKATTSARKDGALTVTRVAIEGTFSGGMAARAAGPKPGWRLLGAVVEAPSATYFVKATGPAAVLAREEEAFDRFLASIRLP